MWSKNLTSLALAAGLALSGIAMADDAPAAAESAPAEKAAPAPDTAAKPAKAVKAKSHQHKATPKAQPRKVTGGTHTPGKTAPKRAPLSGK